MLKLLTMKIFLALMIFALAFSGFTAASHAMGLEDCSSAQQELLNDNCAPDVKNSPDHAQKHGKAGSAVCIDCAHCHAPSFVMSAAEAWTPVVVSSSPHMGMVQVTPENRLFSLLRPPKILA